MSTIKVDSIQATGETVSRGVSGVAAAWVNFNGTGTVAVRESENVASLTDTANGVYIVNFSNSMSNADYAALLGSASVVYDQGTLQDTSTASYVGIKVQDGAVSSFIDATIVSANVSGELA